MGQVELLGQLPDGEGLGVVEPIAAAGPSEEADAGHALVLVEATERLRGAVGLHVDDGDGDEAVGVAPSAERGVAVVVAVGGEGLHEEGAVDAGLVHEREDLLDGEAGLVDPAQAPPTGDEGVGLQVVRDDVDVGIDNHGALLGPRGGRLVTGSP